MGDAEGGDRGLHGALSGDLLYGSCSVLSSVLRDIGVVRVIGSVSEAQGNPGGVAASAASGAGWGGY